MSKTESTGGNGSSKDGKTVITVDAAAEKRLVRKLDVSSLSSAWFRRSVVTK